MIRYANPSHKSAESEPKSADDYTVVLTTKARQRLIELDAYLENAASPDIASTYVDAVIDCCQSLALFPHRGGKRDDLHPGLRVTHYKSKTIIAFFVDDTCRTVLIADIFHGGRDYEAALRG